MNRTHKKKSFVSKKVDRLAKAQEHNVEMVGMLTKYMIAHPKDETSKALRGAIFRTLIQQAQVLFD